MPQILKLTSLTVFLEPPHTQTSGLLLCVLSCPRLILNTTNFITTRFLSVHHPTLPCSRGRILQVRPISTINRDIFLDTNATSHLEWVP